MMKSGALVSALLVALCSAAFAQTPVRNDNLYKAKEEGWFWYERVPEEVKKEEVKPPPPKPVPMPSVIKLEAPKENKIEPLSVKWFQEEYLNLVYTAIDNPSEENVRNYRYATRVMLDKASNFTSQFKRQSLLDPLLDESVRSPFASAMRGSFASWSAKAKQTAVRNMNKSAGLWVFLDDECPFCSMQYPIIARLAKEMEFEVFYITPDGSRPNWMMGNALVLKDSGQSKHLRIGVRPAIALVVPPEKVTVLTQGLLSQDLLEERILVAGDAAGLISGKERKNAFPEERGVMTPEDIKSLGEEMLKDKNALTPGAQKRIQERY